ncbi:uncharacterized protein LOC129599099 [Paramacrobiotus metropolitanus]|uniref:uncharacterized protein LOC129599099 n=1 Tax=Paramacrobiotus metropolitanus TaxID=2943436 RepID=UPI0024457037|nr:uncharacterized protein LOC129599099 [Paramacrobiotus metropolitanus]
MQLFDLFEANLIVQKPVNLAVLADWIAHAVECDLCNPSNQLERILGNYQSVDPRCLTPYRGCQWTASDIAHVDVEKLTTITTTALCHTMKKTHWLAERCRPTSAADFCMLF